MSATLGEDTTHMLCAPDHNTDVCTHPDTDISLGDMSYMDQSKYLKRVERNVSLGNITQWSRNENCLVPWVEYVWF